MAAMSGIAWTSIDPPTPAQPKEPVEVITIDRRADGQETVTINKRGEV
jgi:hypothetical protein